MGSTHQIFQGISAALFQFLKFLNIYIQIGGIFIHKFGRFCGMPIHGAQ